ncbi:hypothetical protein J7H91_004624 [Vibrio parahaemolyticus]|nr:hypothetical protein [Vibrio parahaemolyticus]EHH1232592.1 hypothetical protein [Vibrio parahaemolyticus]HAS6480769.1 hypothetical protein [Vibrio parahaemolyticus]
MRLQRTITSLPSTSPAQQVSGHAKNTVNFTSNVRSIRNINQPTMSERITLPPSLAKTDTKPQHCQESTHIYTGESATDIRSPSTKRGIPTIGSKFNPESLLFFNSLQKTANKYNVVLGLRAPSQDGQINLLQGCPTKNFHMKAKSGALGFIYEDPEKSKVPKNKLNKQQQAVESAKLKGAKAIDLVLSTEQIQFAIKRGSLKETENAEIYAVTLQGRDMGFYIDSSNGRAFDSKGTVKVMTNPSEYNGIIPEEKAITADYDLFCIIPRKQQSVNQRPLESRARFLGTIGSHNTDIHEKIKMLTTPVDRHGEESKDKGNIHFFGETIIEDLNKNVSQEGFSGGKLFWHNDETGNPFTPGFDEADKPIFVIPHTPPQQFNDKNSLMMFYRELEQAGYNPEYSPAFGF